MTSIIRIFYDIILKIDCHRLDHIALLGCNCNMEIESISHNSINSDTDFLCLILRLTLHLNTLNQQSLLNWIAIFLFKLQNKSWLIGAIFKQLESLPLNVIHELLQLAQTDLDSMNKIPIETTPINNSNNSDVSSDHDDSNTSLSNLNDNALSTICTFLETRELHGKWNNLCRRFCIIGRQPMSCTIVDLTMVGYRGSQQLAGGLAIVNCISNMKKCSYHGNLMPLNVVDKPNLKHLELGLYCTYISIFGNMCNYSMFGCMSSTCTCHNLVCAIPSITSSYGISKHNSIESLLLMDIVMPGAKLKYIFGGIHTNIAKDFQSFQRIFEFFKFFGVSVNCTNDYCLQNVQLWDMTFNNSPDFSVGCDEPARRALIQCLINFILPLHSTELEKYNANVERWRNDKINKLTDDSDATAIDDNAYEYHSAFTQPDLFEFESFPMDRYKCKHNNNDKNYDKNNHQWKPTIETLNLGMIDAHDGFPHCKIHANHTQELLNCLIDDSRILKSLSNLKGFGHHNENKYFKFIAIKVLNLLAHKLVSLHLSTNNSILKGWSMFDSLQRLQIKLTKNSDSDQTSLQKLQNNPWYPVNLQELCIEDNTQFWNNIWRWKLAHLKRLVVITDVSKISTNTTQKNVQDGIYANTVYIYERFMNIESENLKILIQNGLECLTFIITNQSHNCDKIKLFYDNLIRVFHDLNKELSVKKNKFRFNLRQKYEKYPSKYCTLETMRDTDTAVSTEFEKLIDLYNKMTLCHETVLLSLKLQVQHKECDLQVCEVCNDLENKSSLAFQSFDEKINAMNVLAFDEYHSSIVPEYGRYDTEMLSIYVVLKTKNSNECHSGSDMWLHCTNCRKI